MADLLPDAVLRYDDHDLAVIDVHVPAEPRGPLVVLVHGGFWMQEWDRTHTRPLARALAGHGHLVVTPEYRRVGGGGGWPATGLDVETAVSALPALLAGAGLSGPPDAGTVVLGHSAGGHLALWLASRPVARTVARVVALAPVCDLRRGRELGLDDGAVDRLLGAADIAEADPISLLQGAPGPSVVLVHGERDDRVPAELSRRFVARHPWAELVALPGVGHFEFLDPADPVFAVVRTALTEQTATRDD